jgi:hypothetical protein
MLWKLGRVLIKPPTNVIGMLFDHLVGPQQD